MMSRCAECASFLSSFRARLSNLQTQLTLHVFGGIGLGRTPQTLRGQINVFQVFKMFEDRLACVKGLGASSLLGQTLEAALGIGIEADDQHGYNAAIAIHV